MADRDPPLSPRRYTASRWLRRLARVVGGIVIVLIMAAGVLYLLARPSLGSTPDGLRLERAQRSPNWKGGSFFSGRQSWSPESNSSERSETAAPPPSVDVVQTNPRTLRTAPKSGLRVTWFGHSSTLVQVDGINVLTDPFWSERATPIAGLGPQRWYAPPIALNELPPIDAVVISHDHYDHLDMQTIKALNRNGMRFIVPLGVGAHLETWDIPSERIIELDWWQTADIKGVRIHATPARHYSGRLVPRGNTALWAGCAMVGPRNRVYYTGDTAYMPEMVDIGRRLGPFDLVLTDSGQYNQGWPDVHLGPEQAVQLASAVGAKAMTPIHWGLIRLANHSWPEPAERTLAAANCLGIRALIPPPGLPVEPASAKKLQRWWPQVSWQNATASPIRSTQNGEGSLRFKSPRCHNTTGVLH